MTTTIYIIGTALVSLGIGIFIGRSLLRQVLKREEEEAREKAKLIIREAELNAESVKKDRILEAKEKYLRLKSEFEEEVSKKKNIIIQNENKVKQREQQLNTQLEQIKKKENELSNQKEQLNAQLDGIQKR